MDIDYLTTIDAFCKISSNNRCQITNSLVRCCEQQGCQNIYFDEFSIQCNVCSISICADCARCDNDKMCCKSCIEMENILNYYQVSYHRMATEWCECNRAECIKEWCETTGGRTQNEEDADYFGGGLGFQHCEIPGCHILYYREKSGSVCENCLADICELCAGECIVNSEDDIVACQKCGAAYTASGSDNSL